MQFENLWARHRSVVGWVALVLLTVCWALPGLAQNGKKLPTLEEEFERYQEELKIAAQPVQKRYAARLKTLQKVLMKKGEKEAADEVQAELERLGDADAQQINYPIEGKWKVEYKSGAARTYFIHANGTVEFLEGRTVGRFTRNGEDVLVDFGDNKLERFHWKTVLAVEHYDPKASYGTNEPKTTGFAYKAQ